MAEETTQITNGETKGISPKAYVAALLPVVAGLSLMALDLLGVVDVGDELWLGLIIGGPLAGTGAVAAKTGTVVGK